MTLKAVVKAAVIGLAKVILGLIALMLLGSSAWAALDGYWSQALALFVSALLLGYVVLRKKKVPPAAVPQQRVQSVPQQRVQPMPQQKVKSMPQQTVQPTTQSAEKPSIGKAFVEGAIVFLNIAAAAKIAEKLTEDEDSPSKRAQREADRIWEETLRRPKRGIRNE